MIEHMLESAGREVAALAGRLHEQGPGLRKLAEAMMLCWRGRGKVLLAGNGGSMADAVHFAEELTVRYRRNRKALAAIALADVSAITCAANDFGYDSVFSRQVEALGQTGDLLIVFSTSGNSPSILRALEAAKRQQLVTCAFLGKDGGRARGQADIEFLIPHTSTARIQEIHQVMFHVICEWVDEQVEE